MGTSAGTGEPRTKPATVRREDLLSAAERLFLEQGLEATTVEQITAAAGVAKGTFYLQFAAKEELVQALRERCGAEFQERLRSVVAEVPADHHAARLAVWTAVSVDAFLEKAPLHALLFQGPRDYLQRRTGDNPLLRQLHELLEAGARADAWSLPDPLQVATFLFHGLHGLLGEAVARQPAPERSLIEEAVMAMVERLVLASD